MLTDFIHIYTTYYNECSIRTCTLCGLYFIFKYNIHVSQETKFYNSFFLTIFNLILEFYKVTRWDRQKNLFHSPIHKKEQQTVSAEYWISTTFKPFSNPPKKIGQILRNPKDQRHSLSFTGVYKIPCSCGKVYIDETGRMINIRMKEHQRDVILKHTTQSALLEHNIEIGH